MMPDCFIPCTESDAIAREQEDPARYDGLMVRHILRFSAFGATALIIIVHCWCGGSTLSPTLLANI